MQVIYPPKLQKGDKIAIVAPARSFSILSEETVERAIKRLNDLGLEVVLGKHIAECDEFLTSSVASRVEDIHTAFSNPRIKGIFSVVGGYSSNQLLDYLDYELIKANPKIVC
jgi:muramoyltetrapeptide carboxypeptidase LdcA involved in peptidoglycan recycling